MCQRYSLSCEFISRYNPVLVRVIILDEYGKIVLDEYVKQMQKVLNDNDHYFSKIRKEIKRAIDKSTLRNKVARLLCENILIGHSLSKYLDMLELSHPEDMQRDLANYKPFMYDGESLPLEDLTSKHLDRKLIQTDDPIQIAHACLDLYLMYSHQWESGY